MGTNPGLLSEEQYDVPPPFEGEQPITLSDYEVKDKANGFWVLMRFSGDGGERTSWSGNFFKPAAIEEQPGRKVAHARSWRELREFFKAVGYSDGDIPQKPSSREIAVILEKMTGPSVTIPFRVKGNVYADGAYTAVNKFKAA